MTATAKVLQARVMAPRKKPYGKAFLGDSLTTQILTDQFIADLAKYSGIQRFFRTTSDWILASGTLLGVSLPREGVLWFYNKVGGGGNFYSDRPSIIRGLVDAEIANMINVDKTVLSKYDDLVLSRYEELVDVYRQNFHSFMCASSEARISTALAILQEKRMAEKPPFTDTKLVDLLNSKESNVAVSGGTMIQYPITYSYIDAVSGEERTLSQKVTVTTADIKPTQIYTAIGTKTDSKIYNEALQAMVKQYEQALYVEKKTRLSGAQLADAITAATNPRWSGSVLPSYLKEIADEVAQKTFDPTANSALDETQEELQRLRQQYQEFYNAQTNAINTAAGKEIYTASIDSNTNARPPISWWRPYVNQTFEPISPVNSGLTEQWQQALVNNMKFQYPSFRGTTMYRNLPPIMQALLDDAVNLVLSKTRLTPDVEAPATVSRRIEVELI